MSDKPRGKVVSQPGDNIAAPAKKPITVADAAAALEVKSSEQPKAGDSVSSFLLDAKNRRKYNRKEATLKAQRHQTEVEFCRGFTSAYITGKLPKENIVILGDLKRYLFQLPNNPYNLKDPATKEANAFVQADMVEICVVGTPVGPELVKLSARTVGKNRVCYFDPILAQKLILEAPTPEEKTLRTERLKELNTLPQRDGYRSGP